MPQPFTADLNQVALVISQSRTATVNSRQMELLHLAPELTRHLADLHDEVTRLRAQVKNHITTPERTLAARIETLRADLDRENLEYKYDESDDEAWAAALAAKAALLDFLTAPTETSGR